MTFPDSYSNFLPDQRWWEIQNERFRETDALYRIGEYSAFVYMWKVEDFDGGYVDRCPTCLVGSSAIDNTYNQPTFDRCPTCYGALYAGPHGGVKALYIRPAIWQFGEKDLQWLPKGETEVQNATVTTTYDVRLFKRDYVFRGDGLRFGVNSVQGVHLSAGAGTQSHTQTALTYTFGLGLEHQSSPAYLIPPDIDTTIAILTPPYPRYLPDFTQWQFDDGNLGT